VSARHGEGESARVRTVGKGPQRVVASGVGVSLVLVRGQTSGGRGGAACRPAWGHNGPAMVRCCVVPCAVVRACTGTRGAGAAGSGKRRGESKLIEFVLLVHI
jgi:hypothetical protein